MEDSWEKDFEKLSAEVDAKLEKVSKAVYSNMMPSPVLGDGGSPVWSGSYLASHRISFDEEPVMGPTYRYESMGLDMMFPRKISETEEAMLRTTVSAMGTKLDNVKDVKTVTISNEIGHSEIVEDVLEYKVYARALAAGEKADGI